MDDRAVPRGQTTPRLAVVVLHGVPVTQPGALIAKRLGKIEVIRSDADGASRTAAISRSSAALIHVADRPPDWRRIAASVGVLDAEPQQAVAAHSVAVTPSKEGREFALVDALLTGNLQLRAAVFRRFAFEQVGGYCPELNQHADLDLWLRMLSAGLRFCTRPAGLASPPRRGRIGDQVLHQEATERALLLARHSDLFAQHADAVWASLLSRRARLNHYKSRYGPVLDAVSRLRSGGRR